MMKFALAVVATLPLLPSVFGHGQVHRFITSTHIYQAADAYAAADPNTPIRKLNTYGPAAPFTGADITCGPGGNVPVSVNAPVVAGTEVTFDWTSWSSTHPGPIMTYIAQCTGGCASFKGDSGNVWVKIDHDGYVGTRTPQPWAEETLRSESAQTYTVTIPKSLANGEYLLRHEILGLHVASQLNGAQFYPNCVQITVSGGGSTTLPTGIALPGAYVPTDPSILVQLYQITPTNSSYVIPGGAVLLDGSSTHRYSSGPPPGAGTATGDITSAAASSTAVGGTATTTSSASGAVQTAYGQCGGSSWTGATSCVSGYKCVATNVYYSQCIPS